MPAARSLPRPPALARCPRFGTRRDALTSQIITLLEGAEFNKQAFFYGYRFVVGLETPRWLQRWANQATRSIRNREALVAEAHLE